MWLLLNFGLHCGYPWLGIGIIEKIMLASVFRYPVFQSRTRLKNFGPAMLSSGTRLVPVLILVPDINSRRSHIPAFKKFQNANPPVTAP
jgi:hypothetical protein